MKDKIGAINLLRFIAALGVLLYHYTFMFYQRGFTYLDFGVGRSLFQYGYLGVDLFFIISGFVIALSAEGRTAWKFLISRLARLYPLFWISVSITSFFLLFGGNWISSEVTASRYLAGLTMIPGLFNQIVVDGSYWSLEVELKFYTFIFIIIALGLFKKLESITNIITIGLVVATIFLPTHLNWIANFMAGIIFYKIYTEGLTKTRILGLFTLLSINLYYVIYQITDLELGYKTDFNPWIIGLHICIFYGIFILIALNKLVLGNSKILNLLGLLTYPIYLLHQQIGQIIFKIYEYLGIPLYLAFIAVLTFILGMAYVIHTLFEEKGRKIITSILNKMTPH